MSRTAYWTIAMSTVAAIATTSPAAPGEIKLWPAGAPGLPEQVKPEKVLADRGDGVERVTNVSEPTIAVHKPDRPTGTCVLVCPGGGYSILATSHEGTDVCDWLNSNGVTAVLLKYRVPKQRAGALQDAQRAISTIRHHAKEWGIHPDRIGILGFSAGGHLAAAASTSFSERSYERIDEADEQSCRPDFSVLVYPAYLTGKGKDGIPKLLVNVDKNTPPAFLVHAQNDRITADNSLFYFRALKEAGVDGELHIYPKGGHGFGMKDIPHPIGEWPRRCAEWMQARGLLAE